MLLLKATIMGVVEGLTEFLPVSSTGHLILTGALLGMSDDKSKVFDIAIQTGAILAVIIVYWQRIYGAVSSLGSSADSRRFVFNVVLGFLPAGLVGLFVYKSIKAHLFNGPVVATAFIVGGLIILVVEKSINNQGARMGTWASGLRNHVQSIRIQSQSSASGSAIFIAPARIALLNLIATFVDRRHVATVDDMSPLDALKVGLVQCLGMIPGTSRSGSTIIGGMLLGLSRKAATDFSFFLAIPTLIAAGGYSLWKERHLLSSADLPLFVVGLVVSFVSAWVCVRWLLRYVASHNFVPFAWYRIAFGLVVLGTYWTGLIDWKG